MSKCLKHKSDNMAVSWFCAVILAYNVFGAEVDIEYYLSQSVHTHYKEVRKREIKSSNTFENVYTNNSGKEIKWRQFEQEENEIDGKIHKRALDPVFHGHPKTREELWNEHFLNESSYFDQTPSLTNLIHNISLTYLKNCVPVILYDNQVKSKESYLVENLLKGFPMTFIHGYINDSGKLVQPKLLHGNSDCQHFILFLADIRTSAKLLGKQPENKVIIVARSSQWAVQEFLASVTSRMFVNLLVIGQSFKEEDDVTMVSKDMQQKF